MRARSAQILIDGRITPSPPLERWDVSLSSETCPRVAGATESRFQRHVLTVSSISCSWWGGMVRRRSSNTTSTTR